MKSKIAVGLLCQWYELKILPACLDSLWRAIDIYGPEYVYVDICLNLSQDLEKVGDEATLLDIEREFAELIPTGRYEMIVNTVKKGIYSIADYRRDFNATHCNDFDLLMWHETDALIPSKMFDTIDFVYKSVEDKDFVITPASCKMWGPEWKVLEHPDFTDKPFIEGDTENWWSLRYNMSYEEMEEINRNSGARLIYDVSPLMFNGCGLVMTGALIESGLNIPQSAFFVDDTPYLMMLRRYKVKQFVLKNLLMVHNRKHPLKRWNIKGEEHVENRGDMGKLRACQPWYKWARKYSDENALNLFNPNYQPKGWGDVFKAIN